MNNELYLIHKEDYLNHIHNQIHLYTMIKQMSFRINHLPSNRGNKELSKMAECFDSLAESMFRSTGIPKSYIFLGNETALAELMENELIAPEDARYYPIDNVECDGDGCCGDCRVCCSEDDEGIDDFAETMSELSDQIHSIFGDDVAVHIVID